MHLDILIFALIAGFLIYRLRSVLGTRHGDERTRPNPFAAPQTAIPQPLREEHQPLTKPVQLIDSEGNKDGQIDTGLDDIAAVDRAFDVQQFMEGARYAFEMIVKAYGDGDRATLKPLLSQKLYADFEREITAREAAGHTFSTEIHRVKSARIVEAHLGGTMAYVTVDFDVEQTAVKRDQSGAVIEGDPDRIANVEDIWTFTRDTRNSDPNWILIETRAAEK